MSSQTRTLLVILALAFTGVSGLAFMAHRYGKILEQKATGPSGRGAAGSPATGGRTRVGQAELRASTESADGLVEGFIVVRRAIRGTIDELEGRTPRTQEVAAARDRALVASGMDTDTYLTVRRVYRAWREGRERKGTPLARAFEARRETLTRLDLGDYERLD